MRAKVRLKALRIPNPCEIIRTRARSEAIGTPLQQMDPHERLGPNQSAKIEAECLTTAQSTAKMQVRSGSKSLSVHFPNLAEFLDMKQQILLAATLTLALSSTCLAHNGAHDHRHEGGERADLMREVGKL